MTTDLPGRITAYAAGLDAGSVVADLHERYFVGLFPVRRHEGGATGNEVIGMQAQDVLVPFLGKLGVAHVYVNVPQMIRCVAHFNSPDSSMSAEVFASIPSVFWSS